MIECEESIKGNSKTWLRLTKKALKKDCYGSVSKCYFCKYTECDNCLIFNISDYCYNMCEVYNTSWVKQQLGELKISLENYIEENEEGENDETG